MEAVKMSSKVIKLDAHSFTQMRRRHRVHFGAGFRTNVATSVAYQQPHGLDVVSDDGWELPPAFEVDASVRELVSTVNDLLESMAEAQREVIVAESQRDDAITATLETGAERDAIATERDFLLEAHGDVSVDLADAHQEIDTLRAALGEVSHTLRKSNANVRRLYDDMAAIRRDVAQIANSPWAKVVRKRLLTAIQEWD
jgi:hypothetical protein